jgi:hypothetical protein
MTNSAGDNRHPPNRFGPPVGRVPPPRLRAMRPERSVDNNSLVPSIPPHLVNRPEMVSDDDMMRPEPMIRQQHAAPVMRPELLADTHYASMRPEAPPNFDMMRPEPLIMPTPPSSTPPSSGGLLSSLSAVIYISSFHFTVRF